VGKEATKKPRDNRRLTLARRERERQRVHGLERQESQGLTPKESERIMEGRERPEGSSGSRAITTKGAAF